MPIVMDKVGCNLSQENSNTVSDDLFLTGDDHAYNSVTTCHSLFNVLGLVTVLYWCPILCVMIYSGKKYELAVMTGIDWNAVDNHSDTIVIVKMVRKLQ